ncbi:GNAT family N-acetyltransferase [Bordetella bronchiseptica]|uniref:Acetyltransferase n=1 Tax=Bordetella bronchiseptica (strain ATCC BAA-588 / NCTC 13252 / RB50) TaxID=257310 RepID=A0A0H3LPA6_BORBR|nr:GNAT family N-acetyltransferase [Bordetella bronchiseptica]KAK66204.1 acetyltransferase (GNAT) domain protein [Bordetella bronchiseptica 980-2]KDD61241.1 acetyltransferase (GNAT) domain protein [Bordetella bronchiseptica OSU553]AMG87677.1 N-acetyltransferase [Bordetella bronchiseptica]KCV52401.1 acetyltransferase (GNAT) domain protein [Bordetella bronchiseptica 3E44]KCV61700.1 acetyltransferase (GNAT) domain protein [Bordetella bronchiseptica 980]
MSLVIRPARGEELARAAALVARSINDLTERHGFGAIAAPRPPDFQAFCLRDDPRGVWLAEDDGEILGFALSWVCDRFWFLAELFVAPGGQGQGIGNELLGRTLGHADQAGASTKSLITFAFNTVSQGLYVRHGLLPRLPIHLCSAERASLAQRLPRPALHARPIQATPADLELLRELDMASLDVSRAKHHRYLLEEAPGMRGVFLDDGAEPVGYAYVAASGHVGPLAVMHAGALPDAFHAALALAAAGQARQITVFVPGASAALAPAVRLGMRFVLPMVLMSSHDSGDWSRYLPRNPGFM